MSAHFLKTSGRSRLLPRRALDAARRRIRRLNPRIIDMVSEDRIDGEVLCKE